MARFYTLPAVEQEGASRQEKIRAMPGSLLFLAGNHEETETFLRAWVLTCLARRRKKITVSVVCATEDDLRRVLRGAFSPEEIALDCYRQGQRTPDITRDGLKILFQDGALIYFGVVGTEATLAINPDVAIVLGAEQISEMRFWKSFKECSEKSTPFTIASLVPPTDPHHWVCRLLCREGGSPWVTSLGNYLAEDNYSEVHVNIGPSYWFNSSAAHVNRAAGRFTVDVGLLAASEVAASQLRFPLLAQKEHSRDA